MGDEGTAALVADPVDRDHSLCPDGFLRPIVTSGASSSEAEAATGAAATASFRPRPPALPPPAAQVAAAAAERGVQPSFSKACIKARRSSAFLNIDPCLRRSTLRTGNAQERSGTPPVETLETRRNPHTVVFQSKVVIMLRAAAFHMQEVEAVRIAKAFAKATAWRPMSVRKIRDGTRRRQSVSQAQTTEDAKR